MFWLELIIAAVTILVLDGLWLGLVAAKLYRKLLGSLMRQRPNRTGAVLFYLVYVVGLVVLAVEPSWTIGEAIWRGAALGGVSYATYELTNLATLKDWPVKLVVIDIAWGMFITATAAGLAKWLG